MTPLQLSPSKQALPGRSRISESSRYNKYLRSSINFYYSVCGLRLLTFLWLYWTYRSYLVLLERPAALFSPENVIARFLLPAMPAPALVLAVVAAAVACNGYLLFYRKSILLQVLLFVCLYWLNLPLWSYGYLSHVNHLFLLAHLFLVVVQVEKPSQNVPDSYQYRSINWFYGGLLATYSMAGLWKVAALAYKLVQGSADAHWLHPDAALYNAIVSYRALDLPFVQEQLYTSFPLFWQAGFLLTLYIQTFAVAAAFRPPLRPWMGLALLLLHVLNAVLFQTYFVVASLVLLCLCLPYTQLYPKPYLERCHPYNAILEGRGNQTIYKRMYPNGDTDVFYGVRALREHCQDRQYLLAGLLYFPGVATCWRALLKLQRL